MNYAITGDRNYEDQMGVWGTMAGVLAIDPDAHWVLGDCPTGADKFALDACIKLDWSYEVHKADWARYRRGAGPKRNTAMLDRTDGGVLAFHTNIKRSKGTKDCVKQALARGLKVVPCGFHLHELTEEG